MGHSLARAVWIRAAMATYGLVARKQSIRDAAMPPEADRPS